MGGLLFLLVIGGIIWIAINRGKKAVADHKQKMVDAGADDLITVKHVEGLGIQRYATCDVFRLSEKLVVVTETQKFDLDLKQIRAAVVKSEQELVEKSKNVVGRAIIGTLLVPGLGTIVGGLSGLGTKTKKGQTRYFMIFNYTASNGELSAVTFTDDNAITMQAFCNRTNKALAPYQTESIKL